MAVHKLCFKTKTVCPRYKMYRHLLFLFYFAYIQCEATEKPAVVESGKMIGLNTIHVAETIENVDTASETVKIDKNTIITRNLKLQKRNKGKDSNNVPKSEEREPDWSYSAVPKEISSYVQQFKQNMTECLKEVQDNDKRTVRRLSPKTESPVHGECLIACVFKRNAVIVNNKVNKENLIHLVTKFFGKDTRLMKKLEKNLDQCIEMSAHHHDECDLAAKLNECTNDLMASNKHKIVVNY